MGASAATGAARARGRHQAGGTADRRQRQPRAGRLAGVGKPPVDQLGWLEAAAHREQLARERVAAAGPGVGVGVAGLAVDLRDVGGTASLMVGAGAVVGLQREQRDPMPLGDQREQRDEARRDPTKTEVVLLLLLLVQEL